MHDRRIQARLHALVQEHTVEQDAGGRVQTEGDVRQTQRGLHVRMPLLQLPDALDRRDAVLAGLLLPGADGERQTVHEDVRLVDAPVPGQVGDQPLGDLHLLLRRTGLALLVDGQRDQRRTMLPGQRGHLREPGLRTRTVLVVHRVDHRTAAELLQPRPDDVDLGGVQHDGQRRRGREPARQLLHVGHAVPAHVVHAQVQHVRALADLVPGHLHTVVPAALQHRLTELLRPVRVRPLTDRQVGGVLPERHRLVQGGGARLGARVPLGGRGTPHPLDDLAQMLGRGAAAAAHQRQPVLAHERLLRVRQLRRGQRVVRAVLAEDGQAGVGHARQRDAGVAGEVAQVLAHLGRAGRAVHADHVDAERLQRGQRGADLRAEQHRAGRLDRDGDDDGQVETEGVQGAPGAEHGRLGLQEVLGGLHEQRVGAAGDQSLGVALVGVAQDGVRGVAERGQLGAGADGAEDPALPSVLGGERVGGLAGDPGARLGQLVDALRDVVLAERGVVGAEGVGAHAVDTGGEVLLVHRADDVRAGDVEDLVAALQLLEVVQRRVLRLEHGAHRAVGDHHAGGEGLSEGGHAGPGVGGRGGWRRGHERAP